MMKKVIYMAADQLKAKQKVVIKNIYINRDF